MGWENNTLFFFPYEYILLFFQMINQQLLLHQLSFILINVGKRSTFIEKNLDFWKDRVHVTSLFLSVRRHNNPEYYV